MENIGAAKPGLISAEQIDSIIRTGYNIVNHKGSVLSFFQEQKSLKNPSNRYNKPT